MFGWLEFKPGRRVCFSLKPFWRLISALVIIGVFALPSYAQFGETPEIDPRAAGDIQSNTASERLSVLTNDLIGDHIDLDTGGLSLSNTDVSLPGNSKLPVQFGRLLNRSRMSEGRKGWMGDWNPDIPHISRRYIQNYVPPASDNAPRCTVGNQGAINGWFKSFQPETYWRGTNMVGFNGASKYMLKRRTSDANQELDGKTPKYLTQDYWLIECINTATPSNEGFKATAPNGDIYTFDHTVAFDGGNAFPSSISSQSNPIGDTGPEAAFNEITFVTRIEDVHGNWVVYDYNAGGKPYKISSNDGRQIDISWSGEQISSVSANSRVWSYQYGTCTGTGCKKLTQVTLPDNRTWSYGNMEGISGKTSSELCPNDTHQDATVTHPTGTTALFKFNVISNGRTNLAVSLFPSEWGQTPHDRCFAGAVNNPRSFNSVAVVEKTLTIIGSPDATWLYEYDQDEGQYYGDANLNPPDSDDLPNGDLAPTKWREVTQPDGSLIRTLIDRAYGYAEGKAVEVKALSDSGIVLQTKTNTYELGDFVGGRTHGHYNAITFAKTHIVSEVKSETARDGDVFTTESSYQHDTSISTYSYGNPTSTSVYSNVSTTPRETVTTYEHNTSKWVLGLPKTITQCPSSYKMAQI